MYNKRFRILNKSGWESCFGTLDDLELHCFSLGNSEFTCTVSFRSAAKKKKKGDGSNYVAKHCACILPQMRN